jgi:hypothetical protein
MPQQSHLEKTIDEFDKKIESAKWAFRSYGNSQGFKDQNQYAEDECKKLKHFIIQSHINYLEGEIERTTKMKKQLSKPHLEAGDWDMLQGNGYNICIESNLRHLQSQLEEAKKML